MISTYKLADKVVGNLANVNLKFLLLPFLLLLVLVLLLFKKSALTVDGYVNIQEDWFFFLNSELSEAALLQFNLTQLGDALILFPLLAVFIVYAPKIWGALLTSSVITLVVSFVLKELFAVPRPASKFDNDSFVIIGRMLDKYTSLPSGHSITTFAVITIVLFAFMPKKPVTKVIWSIFILSIGLMIAFSRVGVGAHYPLDVVIGSIIGYICALVGIVINNNVNWWNWIENQKYHPIFMLIFTIWIFAIIEKTSTHNLLILYCSIFSLIATLYLMAKIYVKK